MVKGKIHSICISPEKGELKKEILEAKVIENHGIENDGHAGDWDRQVTCLDYASLLKTNVEHNLKMGPGDFAENILIEGLDLVEIGVGGQLKLGEDVILQVSQIGKDDHPSVVTRNFGVSLLPYEGLFCKVLAGGQIRKGDIAEVVKNV
ncbi:MAG TPA: MOSC domain-containing protein [Syntrophomonadaceae bacterium]|nr:MOSC domain-containing protein [Syntrophomonadaceae bacterium]